MNNVPLAGISANSDSKLTVVP